MNEEFCHVKSDMDLYTKASKQNNTSFSRRLIKVDGNTKNFEESYYLIKNFIEK